MCDKEPDGGTVAAATAEPDTLMSDPPTLSPQPQPHAQDQARAVRVTAVFDATTDQVRYARHFAEAMLRDWPVASDAAMIVSELAANASLHSASHDKGKFWVHLEAYPGQFAWVEVRDQGGQWIRRNHRDGRPHGLDIIGELADDWGVEGDARTGWITWARLDLPEPP